MVSLILTLIIAAGGYVLTTRIWPYTACNRCDGGKLYQSILDSHYRHCPRCDGTGRTLRPAVIAMNAIGMGGKKGRIKR